MSKYSEKKERQLKAKERTMATIEEVENVATPTPKPHLTPQEQSRRDKAANERAALPHIVAFSADVNSALALLDHAVGEMQEAMPHLYSQHKGDGTTILCMIIAIRSKLHAAAARGNALEGNMQ